MLRRILGRQIADYVARHKAMVVVALILTALSSICVVVPAYLLQPFVDEGMKSGNEPVSWKIPWLIRDGASWFSWKTSSLTLVENVTPNRLLLLLTFVAFLSIFFKSVTGYLGGVAASAFCNRVVLSVRVDLFERFMGLPLGYYHKRKSGELIARATADLTVMQSLISGVLLGIIEYPISTLVFLVYLFVMNAKLTLIVFLVVPILLGLSRGFARKIKRHAFRVQDTTAKLTSAYQESLLCLKLIQGFVAGTGEVRKFSALAQELYRRIMLWSKWQLGLGPTMDSAVFLVLPAVLIIGKVYYEHTLGELMSMIYAFSRAYSPAKRLAMVNNNLKTLQGATDQVFEILETVPDIQDPPSRRILPRHEKDIVFHGVSFGYEQGEAVLKDISLRIGAGRMVAFVGSTGAGKSTLLDLIPRFYDVTEGAITIDGVDIKDVTLDSLRGQIGIVSQEVLLFHDTIRNNLRYGNPSKSFEAIEEAARASHAHDFILAQPQGYETVVGDRGTLLSGGQKQRIAIGRAILVDPAILILDEAASALDTESERLIQATLERLRGRMTILVVAHRLSTIMRSDEIFVLEGGRIVESGTSEELLQRKGRFKQLHELQFS